MTKDTGGTTGPALTSKAVALISALIGDLDKAREEAGKLRDKLAVISGEHDYQLADRDGGALRQHAHDLAEAMESVSGACEDDAMYSLLGKLKELGNAEDKTRILLRSLAAYSGVTTGSPASAGAEVSSVETPGDASPGES